MSKIHHISIQFFQYFAVALIGYVFDIGTLFFVHEILKLHYLISGASGFVIGLIIVYLLSNRYVFGESKIQSKSIEFGIFAMIGLVGLGILTLIMWILTDNVGINYLVSKIIATIFVYMWNFFARRSLYHD